MPKVRVDNKFGHCTFGPRKGPLRPARGKKGVRRDGENKENGGRTISNEEWVGRQKKTDLTRPGKPSIGLKQI